MIRVDVKGESQIDEANRSAGSPPGPRVLFIATCTSGSEASWPANSPGWGSTPARRPPAGWSGTCRSRDCPLAAVREQSVVCTC